MHTLTESQQAKVHEIQQSHPACGRLWQEVFANTRAKSKAIKAFCQECQGFSPSDVRDCMTDTCPFWRMRPYQYIRKRVSKPRCR